MLQLVLALVEVFVKYSESLSTITESKVLMYLLSRCNDLWEGIIILEWMGATFSVLPIKYFTDGVSIEETRASLNSQELFGLQVL